MLKTNKTAKKLTLTTETLVKLRDNLTDDQLKVVVGGGLCPESNGSKQGQC